MAFSPIRGQCIHAWLYVDNTMYHSGIGLFRVTSPAIALLLELSLELRPVMKYVGGTKPNNGHTDVGNDEF